MRSLVVSAPEGDTLYGKGHVSCALAAGRNGIVVLEHSEMDWLTVLSVPTPIAGWAHVALVYKAGAPSLYIDGKLAGSSQASGSVVHPGLKDCTERDGAQYFDGDMNDPELFTEVLGEDRIGQLAASGIPSPIEPPDVEWVCNGGSGSRLVFWKNGTYERHGVREKDELKISEIDAPMEISGPWQVSFPPHLGAPSQVTLPQLISLHQHAHPGVKYFSGTATYSNKFIFSSTKKGLYLDLGWVHVQAQVRVNGHDLGLLWKPPFRVDISSAVQPGENKLEVLVTNQWVNRLIGDEQLPAENDYDPSGHIKVIPDWYLQGKPKPAGGRTTFATWKHFDKDSPLLASGLVGPVRLRTAVIGGLVKVS